MFQKFLSWVKDQGKNSQKSKQNNRPVLQIETVVEEAITFFGKKQEYESFVENRGETAGTQRQIQWTFGDAMNRNAGKVPASADKRGAEEC